jgi:hypothetical protein
MFFVQNNLIRETKIDTEINKFVIPKIFNVGKIFQVDSEK